MAHEQLGVRMHFSPNLSNIQEIDFRPYMIECAYDYYMVARMSNHQRMDVQCVMSALSIEVVLKSFNVEVTGNHGQLNETYQFNKKALTAQKTLPRRADAHDLTVLFETLPESIQKYLFDKNDLTVLVKNKDLFKHSRYVYEQSANTIHFDDIIKLAAKLICKVVCLYKGQGCEDPFIKQFDVDELYFNDVQQFIFVSAP